MVGPEPVLVSDLVRPKSIQLQPYQAPRLWARERRPTATGGTRRARARAAPATAPSDAGVGRYIDSDVNAYPHRGKCQPCTTCSCAGYAFTLTAPYNASGPGSCQYESEACQGGGIGSDRACLECGPWHCVSGPGTHSGTVFGVTSTAPPYVSSRTPDWQPACAAKCKRFIMS